MAIRVLYISYDGMTDPLGQSQVIPYLAGLSKRNYSFTLISCEKKENYTANKEKIAQLLKRIILIGSRCNTPRNLRYFLHFLMFLKSNN